MSTQKFKKCRCCKVKTTRKFYRGVCSACYQSYYRCVELGRTSWEQLEAEGKTKPKHASAAMESLRK